MSLEEALIENTQALRALSAQLAGMNSVTAAVEGAQEAGEAATGKKRGRPAKAAADTPPTAGAGTEAAQSTTAGAGSVLIHQLDEPLYFVLAARNMAYEIRKGDPLTIIPGSVQSSLEAYTAAKAEFEAKATATIAATNKAAAAPAPAAAEVDPFGEAVAPVVELTYEGLVERLKTLRTAKGTAKVMEVLGSVGLTTVPALASRKDLFAKVAEALDKA